MRFFVFHRDEEKHTEILENSEHPRIKFLGIKVAAVGLDKRFSDEKWKGQRS